jgi:hypothetical protein
MYIYIELEYWKTEILQASWSQSRDMTSTKLGHPDQGGPHYLHGPLFIKICTSTIERPDCRRAEAKAPGSKVI